MPQATLAELQAKIAKHAWEDPAFEAEFMANPKKTFEKYTAQTLPSELQVHAHYNTSTELHFVVPKRVGAVDGELSDDDLDRVAGGEIVASVILTISMIATTVLATTVAANADNW